MRSCAVFPLPAANAFGRRLARHGQFHLARLTRHEFPDGEVLVRASGRVPQDAIVVQYLDHPNGKIMETLLAADALRQGGAERVVLVAPYLPYMRQDKVFRAGEPLSQKVFGKLLKVAFDAVITVEPHLHRVRRLAQVVPGRAVSAASVLARWLQGKLPDAWIVGPDAESERWVAPLARRLRQPWMVGTKQRISDTKVQIRFPQERIGPRAVLVDDIVSSGGTLLTAARELRRLGVSEIHAVVVHPLFGLDTARQLRSVGVERLVSCDTIPHPTNRISCIPELVAALRRYLA